MISARGSQYSRSDSPRSLWIIDGSQQHTIECIKELVQGLEDKVVVVSNTTTLYAGIKTVNCKQAMDLLGQEKYLVIVDMHDDLCVDALAAITGLIVSGGGLLLSMPARDQWKHCFNDLFSQRFIHYLTNSGFAKFVGANDITTIKDALLSIDRDVEDTGFQLTDDQICVIEQINKLVAGDSEQALVVVSDRGRGKSTALGVAAAGLLKQQKITILITAPSFKSCEMAFTHAKQALGVAKNSQARLLYEQSEFRFLSPDELLLNHYEADLVLIDEAASIPLPLLNKILNKYSKAVFVSTVHGYEGTGRGFFIRFFKDLDCARHDWQKLEMKTPVRWAEDDALEQWLFDLLCLDAEVAQLADEVDTENIVIRQIDQQELASNEKKLRQLFALLVLAHYRTRPSDLQRILSEPVSIMVAELDGNIIAASLSIDEGNLEASLADAIYAGERRAQGHLLAQTLTYHCGVKHAACHYIHRIMRIVVHPQWQSHGVGSKLLDALSALAKTNGSDVIGASFGMTTELSAFWQKNHFTLVRIGFKREQSSGEHAAIYIRPLTADGEEILQQSRRRFDKHLPYLTKTILSDVDDQIIDTKRQQQPATMSELDWQDLQSFVNYSRAYEICIAGVNKWASQYIDDLKQYPDSRYYQVVDLVLNQFNSWKQVAEQSQLDGKKQAQQIFRQAIIYLWEQHRPAGIA